MVEKVRLSPPWVTYAKELQELFRYDPEVVVKFNEEDSTVKLYVDNTDKANALTELLKPCQEFGNVTVRVEVYPANMEYKTPLDLMKTAFKGNSVCSQIKTVEDAFGNKFNYVAFDYKVAQFFNDDMSDLNGNKTMLYKDVAEDVFKEHDGIFFCTDTKYPLEF